MAKPRDNSEKIRQLKVLALRRRMADIKMTEPALAELCELSSRDTVSAWRAGKTWPRPPAERVMEFHLRVPTGFFTRIGDGMDYDDAMKKDGGDDSWHALLQRLQRVIQAPPESEHDRIALERLRRVMSEQVAMHEESSLLIPRKGITDTGAHEAGKALRKKEILPSPRKESRKTGGIGT